MRVNGPRRLGGSGASPDVPASRELAVRVGTVDELFSAWQAVSVQSRSLNDGVRAFLLDEWERVRTLNPSTLTVYAPAHEREATDVEAVGEALRADLRRYSQTLRRARPLTRTEKIAAWLGLAVFLVSIAISTSLDRISSAVLVAGVSQGIVVLGWVALWAPAQTAALDILPHHFARKRYAELAGLEVRFVWEDDAAKSWG